MITSALVKQILIQLTVKRGIIYFKYDTVIITTINTLQKSCPIMNKNQGFRKVSIATLIQDAFDLKVHVETDFDTFTNAGFDPDKIQQLLQRAHEVEKLDVQYYLYKNDYRRATDKLDRFRSECIEVRTALREVLNHAFNIAELNGSISGLSRKRASIDISQDLLALAILAESQKENSPDMFIDSELIVKARQMSDELLQRITQHTLNHPSQSPLNLQRKEAINNLKTIIKEIRLFGRIVLRGNPRVKMYPAS
jgi:uncharacterized protein (DUF2235 family)